jgi:hypothetical protein
MLGAPIDAGDLDKYDMVKENSYDRTVRLRVTGPQRGRLCLVRNNL